MYIRQTKEFKSRSAKHERANRYKRPGKSALCEHVMQLDHSLDWSKSHLLKVENDCFRRITAEIWFISSQSVVIDRSESDRLLDVGRILAFQIHHF